MTAHTRPLRNANTQRSFFGEFISRHPIIALGTVATAGVIGANHFAAGTANHAPIKSILVRPYDTEWGIAKKVHPQGDPGAQVYELDQVLPHDAAHANRNLQPGDRVEYQGDKIVGYVER